VSTLPATRAARRRGIAFGVLLGLSFLMMALSSNPAVLELQRGVSFAFRPIQTALDNAAGTVASIFGALGEIDRLRAENEQLRDENSRLSSENQRFNEVRREIDQLTALLQLQNGLDFKTVAAQVIAREPSEFRRVVTLSKGSNDGVVVGDVVVAQGGALAGRVTEVGSTWATVLLITDTSSTVIGQLSTAATGEVIGQLSSPLTMEKIDSTERVELGQEIVTAGIELNGSVRSPFPKGLVIGQVIDVKRDANAVVQTAYLVQAENLDRLEYVLVITDYHGGLPPIGQQQTECAPEPSSGILPNNEQQCAQPSRKPNPSPTKRP
jgi:rod shape-determining protein MreC